jgi:uncharacterized protein
MHRRDWLYLAVSSGGALSLAKLLEFAPVRRGAGLTKVGLQNEDGPLALPADFSVRVLGRAGDAMTDGVPTPGLPDGMACFQGPDGNWILMRNHEIAQDPDVGGYRKGQPSLAFDSTRDGGVSRLVLDPSRIEVRSSNMVLTGTMLNCSGGPSPWGYLTCEESEDPGHGWVFLCDPGAPELAPAKPIFGYGRFRHEAVAIDPETGTAYLTEDQHEGCLYRFRPVDPMRPFDGQLEFAKAVESPGFPTDDKMTLTSRVSLEWRRVPDPRAEREPLREQCRALGALRVRRGEGIWFEPASKLRDKSVIFTATTGGIARKGQVFRLEIGGSQKPDQLTLLAEAPAHGGMQFPDNITLAPWGDPIVAEDGVQPNHLLWVRPDGSTKPLARNLVSSSEFAGVCFSPDGSTLFCNLQRDGLTLAIRGPWDTFIS